MSIQADAAYSGKRRRSARMAAIVIATWLSRAKLHTRLNGIVAVLAVASMVVFIAAWHSNALELALAPVFATMSVAGLVYMGLLGRGLILSKDS